MSGKQAWRNWAIVFALLVVFAIATAVWSSITPTFSLPGIGDGPEVPSAPPPEIEPIDLSFFGIEQEVSPFLVLGAMAGLFVVLIAVTGVVIGVINVFLSRQAEQVAEGEEAFDPSQSSPVLRPVYNGLDRAIEFVRERKKGQFEGRTTMEKPEHVMPRWSVVSTSLIVIMFVAFLGMVISGTFFPEGEVMLFGSIVNPATIVVSILTLITAVVLAVWLRPQAVLADGEEESIPWDSIVVLVLGLIVVGLALGAMTYILELG